jgi:hypothetical protein
MVTLIRWASASCSCPRREADVGDTPPLICHITVGGALGDEWSEWFDGLAVTSTARGETTLSGPVPDQAAIHGLLAKVRDLGLTLLAVSCVAPE